MAEPWVIPTAALVVSIAALAFTMLGMRHSTTTEYTASLERRIEKLEGELKAALLDNARLVAENLQLMRQLLTLGIPGQIRRGDNFELPPPGS